MKLAVLTGSVSRLAGGTFTSIMRPSQILSAQYPQEVEVFGIQDTSTPEDLPVWRPLVPQVFRRIGPRGFGFAPGYLEAVVNFSPEIIQVHGIWMYFSNVSLRAAKRLGVPCVISPHGMLDPWAVRNSSWKKHLAGLLYENEHLRRAACLRALCTAEAQAMRAYGLKNPICLIPNGIDLPLTEVTALPPWRETIEAGKKVLLFLSRIHEKKGLRNLLRGWAQAMQTKKNFAEGWALAIAGWDTTGHLDDLQELVVELDLKENVYFIGPQFGEEKAAAYAHAEAFILPSYSEGLPMTVLEAWAFGLPVLMTPECNLPEGFAADAALKVTTDVDSIAKGLLRLAEMSDRERKAMGEKGRELVIEKFTWETVAAQFDEIHRWLLGGDAPPTSLWAGN